MSQADLWSTALNLSGPFHVHACDFTKNKGYPKELKKASTRRREKFENLFSLKLYFFKKKKQKFSLNFKHLYLLHDSTNRTTVVRPRCCAVFPDISFLKRSLLFSLFTFMPLWGRRRRRRVFLLLHSHLL